jgi:phosphoribosylformylglycinamidine synthase
LRFKGQAWLTKFSLTWAGTCLQVIGSCNGSGKIVLKDPAAPVDAPTPVDLDLDTILGGLPQKTYKFPKYVVDWAEPLQVPQSEGTVDVLHRILKLIAVGSKRFLTTKVDRCVTGALFVESMCRRVQTHPLLSSVHHMTC